MALPNQLKSARMSDSTLATAIDDAVVALETALIELFGFTADSDYSAGDALAFPLALQMTEDVAITWGGTNNGIVGNETSDYLAFKTNGSEKVRISSGGILFIGDTANTKMTVGVTINQGIASNEGFTLKGSSVSHGMTSLTEPDTFFHFGKELAGGAAAFFGYGPTTFGLRFRGRITSEDTTDTTSSTAAVEIEGQLKSGTSANVLGSTGNVFAVKNSSATTRFLIKGNGDIHTSDADVTMTALDEWNDALLCRAWDHVRAPGRIIKSRWDAFVKYNRKDLVAAGLFSSESPDALLNMSQLYRLHNGAIWQLYSALQEEREARLNLESRLRLLEAA